MNPRSVPGFPGLHDGDRVRIGRVYYSSECRHEGKVGIVRADNTSVIGGTPVVLIVNEPDSPYIFTYATSVEKVYPEPEATEETPAALTRVEAAKVAGSILATDASVAEIVELARYLEGSPQPASPEPVMTVEQARALTERTGYFGGTSVYRDNSADNDVVHVADGYVNRDEIEDFIKYLRAAIVVHDAHPARRRNNAPTPF